uniref:DUF1087 domain-containing protein n=1 Tax=Panagrolaimus sp. ES5 TaxID=591445 RepID=A0AC34GUB4_9BILA
MSKTELDDVLRWGTEELFKDDEPEKDADGKEKKGNEQEIIWDDEAVEALLDRTVGDEPKEASATGGEKKDWTNEYLSSFKVAQYVTRVLDDEEEKTEAPAEVVIEETKEPDPAYWEKLLRHHYEHEQESEVLKLGKGKRVRKQVNYATENILNDRQKPSPSAKIQDDKDYSQSQSDGEEISDGDDSNNEAQSDYNLKSRRGDRDEKLPPLLARVNGLLEVLGFN